MLSSYLQEYKAVTKISLILTPTFFKINFQLQKFIISISNFFFSRKSIFYYFFYTDIISNRKAIILKVQLFYIEKKLVQLSFASLTFTPQHTNKHLSMTKSKIHVCVYGCMYLISILSIYVCVHVMYFI